jgi:hypothetical protein
VAGALALVKLLQVTLWHGTGILCGILRCTMSGWVEISASELLFTPHGDYWTTCDVANLTWSCFCDHFSGFSEMWRVECRAALSSEGGVLFTWTLYLIVNWQLFPF